MRSRTLVYCEHGSSDSCCLIALCKSVLLCGALSLWSNIVIHAGCLIPRRCSFFGLASLNPKRPSFIYYHHLLFLRALSTPSHLQFATHPSQIHTIIFKCYSPSGQPYYRTTRVALTDPRHLHLYRYSPHKLVLISRDYIVTCASYTSNTYLTQKLISAQFFNYIARNMAHDKYINWLHVLV